MYPQPPKAYCYDCGKYVGRRWGDKKVHRCRECFKKILPTPPKKKEGDIPY